MKIAILMPTRGKPHIAAAIVNAGQFLASGEHEIYWILGIDNDDTSAKWFRPDSFPSARVLCATDSRQRALGMIFNRCATQACQQFDPDIYCQFVDDGVIASVDWDETMVDRLAQMPKEIGVISWMAGEGHHNPGQPCFTREWYHLAGFYTEWFPFWWDDTWLAEKWSFVTGSFIPIIPEMYLASRKSVTRRMRDLRFWCEFFAETREDRMEEARIIRERLGVALPANFGWIVQQWQARDCQMLANVPSLEAALGNAGDNEASPLYLQARSRALAHVVGTEMARRWAHFAEGMAA